MRPGGRPAWRWALVPAAARAAVVPAPASVAVAPLCIGDSSTWESEHGNCSTYVENYWGYQSLNYEYCHKDVNEDGLIADQVCPQCGLCQHAPTNAPTAVPTPAPTPASTPAPTAKTLCLGDASTWASPEGDCSTYAENYLGLQGGNFDRCGTDMNGPDGIVADLVCPQCGRCQDASSAVGTIDFGDFEGSLTSSMSPPTPAPTSPPTSAPTVAPTVAPTASPTASPTAAPTPTPPSSAPSPDVLTHCLGDASRWESTAGHNCTTYTYLYYYPVQSWNWYYCDTDSGDEGLLAIDVCPQCGKCQEAAPTSEPTAAPTAAPTASPTASPTAAPTSPTEAAPTSEPTAAPTAAPTASPTAAPTSPTEAPTPAPMASTTTAKAPTEAPTPAPVASTTAAPAAGPAPTPPPSGEVVVRMTVAGVDFALLDADEDLRADFELTCRETVAVKAGVPVSVVEVQLSQGSVVVLATIRVPSSFPATAEEVVSNLQADDGIGASIVSSVSGVAGIEEAADGSAILAADVQVAVVEAAPLEVPSRTSGPTAGHGLLLALACAGASCALALLVLCAVLRTRKDAGGGGAARGAPPPAEGPDPEAAVPAAGGAPLRPAASALVEVDRARPLDRHGKEAPGQAVDIEAGSCGDCSDISTHVADGIASGGTFDASEPDRIGHRAITVDIYSEDGRSALASIPTVSGDLVSDIVAKAAELTGRSVEEVVLSPRMPFTSDMRAMIHTQVTAL